MKTLITCMAILVLLPACTTQKPAPPAIEPDVHSFARPEEAAVKHIELDIAVDFAAKSIRGKASLQIENTTGTNRLVLDIRDMDISKVTLGDNEEPGEFTIGEAQPHMGMPLTVTIRPKTQVVHVYYATRPEAAAVQWLSPAQTAGKHKPFLFTQSQAILARSWVPCQDHLGVRITYNARVTVPAGMMAVMSAENPTTMNPDGVYTFRMPQPIPAYLLALAAGELEFRSLGERSGVYAEPSVVEKAVYEFADTEKMMEAAGGIYGEYRWGRYDILVLPPSFPFGGMENPRLTFATPTILAGDRSLVALIAHELAHSWSGNLVTNGTWGDFWLNEGFTTYFERRIVEALYGTDYMKMQALLGYQDLQATLDELGRTSPMTKLHLDLKGMDPDEAMSDVAYEKGAAFLTLLEQSVGREKWDAFLRTYFDTFAFKTMTTPRFIAYLRENLIKGDQELEAKLKIDEWINGVGLPENCPVPQSPAFAKVDEQASKWLAGTNAKQLATSGWTTHEWLHFVRNLPKSLTRQQMAALDGAFGFTKSGNSEIQAEWFMHVIRNGYTPAYPALEQFLMNVGRRKFLKPLYTEMAASPDGMSRARAIYAKARDGYHPVSQKTMDEILKWSEVQGS